MPDAGRRDHDRLDRYWDALVTGAGQGPADQNLDQLDPTLAAAIRRFQAASDETGIDPAFARRLREELDLNATATAPHVPLSPFPLASPNGVPTRPLHHPWPPPVPRRWGWLPALPTHPRSRRWALVQMAAILLLLATASGAYLAIFGDPRPRTALQPSGSPIPAPVVADDDVPMFRANPAHTGEMPGPGPTGAPVERWRVDTEPGVMSSPAVVDGLVYIVGGDGLLRAFDAASGEERWRLEVSDPTFSRGSAASPAVVGGVVYVAGDVGAYVGRLVAVDAATGRELWRTDSLPGMVFTSSPTVGGGVVYQATGFANATPALADGVVYAGGGDPGAIHAFDAETGDALWSADLGPGLYALDASTGEERWHFEVRDYNVLVRGSPAVADGLVYFPTTEIGGGSGNGFWALDAATGEERWRFATFESAVSPAVVDGTVYMNDTDPNNPDRGIVYALDAATGAERWRFGTEHWGDPAPAVADGVVYVGTNDGAFFAVDAESGDELWQLDLGIEIFSSPAVVGGMIYVGLGSDDTATGAVVALGDPVDGTPTASMPAP